MYNLLTKLNFFKLLFVQGEPGVPDNSVVELLKSELANLNTRLADVEEENNNLEESYQRQSNESKRELSELEARLAK